MHRWSAWVLLAIVSSAACQKDVPAAGSGVGAGTERGDCRADKTCDPGLLCLSDLCVRPPPADCAAVAETLASLDLGNYADVEERAPVIAKYRASCEQVHVTKEEGVCLDKVRDKWSAAQCAPRLFPELASGNTSDCAQVATKIRASMGQQAAAFQNDPKMSKWFETTIKIVQQSCEQDKWPDAVKRCALASSPNDANALQACNQQMPPALQQKMQERMVEAMRQIQP
jgi:hypothetical protein